VLIAAGRLRGSHFHVTAAGAAWFAGAVLLFTVFMYAVAEILANRIPTQEEYVGLTPVVAILPWFLAGSLFPITALPGWLAAVARVLPTTHTLALLRYGVLSPGRPRRQPPSHSLPSRRRPHALPPSPQLPASHSAPPRATHPAWPPSVPPGRPHPGEDITPSLVFSAFLVTNLATCQPEEPTSELH